MASERLQKLLSRRGVASRREAEEWIRRGRVRVNGALVTELGFKADSEVDRVEVDGAPVPPETAPIVVLLHKPPGYVATVRDPHADRTVMDLLEGVGRRVYPVGRLDRDSRGVLLLTDDGELANALLHPSKGVEKVYEVTVQGDLPAESLDRLAAGVELENGPTRPARVSNLQRAPGATRFRLALREGRKRQVRLMIRAVGARVRDLVRVSFAGLTVGGLAEGQWRVLKGHEVEKLRRLGSASAPRILVPGGRARLARGPSALVRGKKGGESAASPGERGPRARDRRVDAKQRGRKAAWKTRKASKKRS